MLNNILLLKFWCKWIQPTGYWINFMPKWHRLNTFCLIILFFRKWICLKHRELFAEIKWNGNNPILCKSHKFNTSWVDENKYYWQCWKISEEQEMRQFLAYFKELTWYQLRQSTWDWMSMFPVLNVRLELLQLRITIRLILENSVNTELSLHVVFTQDW